MAVCTLTLCLSFPALAGHILPGLGWCNCDDPASHQQSLRIDEDDTQHNENTGVDGLELYLETLSMLLRVNF
jgi:hypothetical protein